MAKKLKKKIEELCGLVGLDWETRQERATQILSNSEWKQRLCNDLIGLSFRELEQTLRGVASERQKKEDIDDKRKSPRVGKSKPSVPKPPPRTLQEILAQVYAPRVVQDLSDDARERLLSFRPIQSSNEIPSDFDDGDN